MWTCPECNKNFKNARQLHSCKVVTVESHFMNRQPALKQTYDILLTHVGNFGSFTINPVKSSISLKTISTFLGIKVMKDHLLIEFFLNRKIEEFPVFKTFDYSKNKIVHAVKIDHSDQVDAQLIRWIKESYELVKNTKK